MSKRNPYTIPGNNGRLSHKRFAHKSAVYIRDRKNADKIVKSMRASKAAAQKEADGTAD
jgi:hypothetical protein